MKHDWQAYTTVPRDRPVWLKAPGVSPIVMQWDAGRRKFVGRHAGLMGPVKIWWDESICSPSSWAEVGSVR